MANKAVVKALENLEPLAKILLDLQDGKILLHLEYSDIKTKYSIDIDIDKKLEELVNQNLEVINQNIEGIHSNSLFLTSHELLQKLQQATSTCKMLSDWGFESDDFGRLEALIVKMVVALEASPGETQKDVVPAAPDSSRSGVCTPVTEMEIGEPFSKHGNLNGSAYAKAKDVIALVEQLAITYQDLQPGHRGALATAIEKRLSALSKELELPEYVHDSQLHDLLKQLVALDKKLSTRGIRSGTVQEQISRCIARLGNNAQ